MITVEPHIFDMITMAVFATGVFIVIRGMIKGLFSTVIGWLYLLAYLFGGIPVTTWLSQTYPLNEISYVSWLWWYLICVILLSMALSLFHKFFKLLTKIKIISFLDHAGGLVLSALMVYVIWKLYLEIVSSGLIMNGMEMLQNSAFGQIIMSI